MYQRNKAEVLKLLDALRDFYGIFGAKHPTLSMVVAMILGAGIAGGFWRLAAYSYEKELRKESSAQQSSVPSSVTGPATTSGNQSPANTGNGNVFNSGEPAAPSKQPSKPR
jgi:hypothetical protein